MRINAEIARFDPAVLQDEAGNYKPLKDLPPEARRCIKRIRIHKRNLAAGDGQTDLVQAQWAGQGPRRGDAENHVGGHHRGIVR